MGDGTWVRLAFLPSLEEADRMVREESFGPNARVFPSTWTEKQVKDAADRTRPS